MLDKRQAFIAVFIILFATLFGLQQTGAFRLADTLLADLESRLQPYRLKRSEVVLVEAVSAATPTREQLGKQLALLDQLGAARIILLSRNANYQGFVSELTAAGRIADIVAPAAIAYALEQGSPAPTADAAGPSGAICPPMLEFGFHLRLPARLGPGLPPCFQHVVAAAEPGDLWVNFAQGDAYLPTFSLTQLQQGMIPGSVLAGKTVVLAPDGASFDSISMPGNFPAKGIREARWQALALDNLLQSDGLARWPGGVTAAVLMLLLIGLLLGVQWLSAGASLALMAALVASIMLGGWLSLHYFSLLIPQTLMIAAIVLCLLVAAQLRRRQEEQSLLTSTDQLRHTLSSRLSTADFYTTDQPWQQIIVFVNQQFSLKRSIFLEHVPDDHRLQAIAALNCAVTDIAEQRRDYERTPYSTAIAAGGPLLLEGVYLRRGQPELEQGQPDSTGEPDREVESQYLVPLILGGEVLGFWAFSVPAAQLLSPATLNSVQQFAEEIAELLYHRREWQRSERKEAGTLARMLRFEAGLGPHRNLSQMVQLLIKRHRSSLEVFNELSSAALVYDLFGHVVQTNARLEQLARTWNLPFYQMTALDVLTGVCGLAQEQARDLIQRVTLQRETLNLLATSPAAAGSLVQIKPLLFAQGGTPGEDALTPFSIQGILFEFQVNSRYGQLRSLTQDVYDSARYQIRNHLESAGLAQAILSPKLKEAERPLLRQSGEQLQAAIVELDKLGPNLAKILSHDESRLFPLNLVAALESAQARHDSQIRARRISIDNHLPHFAPLAWGTPAVLAEILDDSIALLLQDTPNQTTLTFTIRVELEDSGKRVLLQCSNEGYGVPQESIHNASPNQALDAAPLEHLLQHQATLSDWQGRLEIDSELGKGFRILIEMRSDF